MTGCCSSAFWQAAAMRPMRASDSHSAAEALLRAPPPVIPASVGSGRGFELLRVDVGALPGVQLLREGVAAQ